MTPEMGFAFFVGLVIGWTLAVMQGRAEADAAEPEKIVLPRGKSSNYTGPTAESVAIDIEAVHQQVKAAQHAPCRQRPDTN